MSQDSPKVSVGLAVYNVERRLRAAIESILGQTFQDLELIISDNASTDGTEAICREYAASDPRVRYHRNPKNLGGAENYNVVFRRARGQYFKWASSNDLCSRGFIDACVKVLDLMPDVVLAYPRTRLVRGDSGDMEDFEDRLLTQQRPCGRFRTLLERRRLNNQLYGLIRAEALTRTKGLGSCFASDYVLLGELTLYGKFVQVPEFMFFRRTDTAEVPMKREEFIRTYFDPEMKNPMLFQGFRFHRECFSAVLRTPLPTGERLCLSRFLLRQFWQDRGNLAHDIRLAGKTWFSRHGMGRTKAIGP